MCEVALNWVHYGTLAHRNVQPSELLFQARGTSDRVHTLRPLLCMPGQRATHIGNLNTRGGPSAREEVQLRPLPARGGK
jgi:hypothetical protein